MKNNVENIVENDVEIENNINSDEFERDYKMLMYFQEEFVYRHKHYWSLVVKSFLLTIGITIIPIVSEIFGLSFNDVVSKFSLIFPILGIFLAIESFYLISKEANRISMVNSAKYKINKKMISKYRYVFVNDNNKKFLSKSFSKLILITEMTIIVIVIVMLVHNIIV